MTAPFIDDTGFNAFGLDNWKSSLESLWRAAYGSALDVSATSPDGQIIGGLAGNFVDLEQLAQTVHLARSASGARGAGLSRLVQLNGITRNAAQFSTAPVTLSGTTGTIIPAGSLIASLSDPNKPAFKTTGTSPADDLTIGGSGTGTVAGQVQCTEAGPVTAAAGELTKILTVISGWTGVTNTADAAPGQQVEADPALRARRAASVALPSQSLADALQAALAALPGVSDAVVYTNNTGATDAKGLPSHSMNAIVVGGTDADIANAIWVNASMGVTKVGSHSLTVTDTQGNPQLMQWDTAADTDVYITIKLDRNPQNLAYIQGQFAAAIVAYYAVDGDLPARIGQNIAWLDIATPINALALTGRQGLPSVTNIFLGDAPSPVLQQDLVIPYKNLAVFDVSRILVTGP
jgi:uncharacterized phage protein gp47/JayE